MNVLLNLYKWLEAMIFNTLNRKILGNLLPLIPIMLLPLVLWWSFEGRLEEVLAGAGSVEELRSSLAALSGTWSSLFMLGAAAGLAYLVITYLFLRFLVVRPVKNMIRYFDSHNSKEANLSETLPVTTVDEFQDLSRSYNQFLENLREMIASVRKMGVNIAVNSCRAARSIGQTTQNTHEQQAMAGEIYSFSEQATQAIDQVAQNCQTLSASTSSNLELARTSMGELSTATEKIDESVSQLQDFEGTVTTLNANSVKISKIVSLIQNIAFQTNLLALNAAVEAARAGQHGKGFAVVAEEVRNLATQVNKATHEVSQSITEVTGLVGQTSAQAEVLLVNISATKEAVDSAHQHFNSIVEDLDENSGQLMRVAAATEQLSTSNMVIHGKVGEVRQTTAVVAEQMGQANEATRLLGGITEEMQEMVSRFVIGRGSFERILSQLRVFRDEAQRILEELANRGVNVMDRNHRPIPNTNPQKYTTAYDRELEPVLQSVQDGFRASLKGVIYCIAMDSSGYIGVHHSDVSQPLTGNFDQDVAKSRHKRIYTANETEVRRAKNTKPFLLQTYSRDTGEILNDLSLPIYVNGQHWGALITGFDPQLLQE